MTNSQTLHGLLFIDAACIIGPYANPESPPGYEGNVEGLVRKMGELGIAEACPSSITASFYNVDEGNRELLQAIAPYPQLHPAFLVAPNQTGEVPPTKEVLAQMPAMSLAKMLVDEVQFYTPLIDIELYGEVFDALAASRTPLLLDYTNFFHEHTFRLRELLKGWPQLPVLLKFPKLACEERVLYYLWEKYENLHVVMSGYQLLGGIEKAVARFGARAFVFGSNSPYFTPLQSMLHLIYCELSEDVKRLIAGDTVRRLLRKEVAA